MSPRAAIRKCLVLASAPLIALESGAQSTLADSMRQRIDQVMATVDHTDAPGCAVGVGQNGEVAYERVYGMSDLQHSLAITPTSIFHVASISKQFAAAAVRILALENRLSLDDDVRKYVSEVPDHGHRVT